MKAKIDLGAHLLLGAVFFVFGLNGFFEFLPVPELDGRAAEYMSGLATAPYFFPVLKVVEVLAGAMLLLRRFVPLALVLLAPVVVQILLFHTMAPEGLPVAVLVTALTAYLGFFVYRDSFRTVLLSRPEI